MNIIKVLLSEPDSGRAPAQISLDGEGGTFSALQEAMSGYLAAFGAGEVVATRDGREIARASFEWINEGSALLDGVTA